MKLSTYIASDWISIVSRRTITRIVLMAHAIHVISEKFDITNCLLGICPCTLCDIISSNNGRVQHIRNTTARYISILVITGLCD